MNRLEYDGNEKDVIEQMLEEYCEKYNVDKEIVVNNTEWQDNDDKETFAMYLAQNNIIPPKEFKHNPNIKGKHINKQVKQYLENRTFLTPIQQFNTQYKQYNLQSQYIDNTNYYFGTSNIDNIKSETQYNSEWTVAMFLADQGIIPPEYWNHNPELQDEYKYTVAMLLAKNGIIPPEQWYHIPYITNQIGKTVQDYLQYYNKEIPDQWRIIDKQIQMTEEIKYQLQKYCQTYNINNQQLIINYPQYQKDFFNYTFAIYLEINNIQVPKEFQYSPECRLKYGMTTAMIIAQQGKLPSNYWNHNPTLQDTQGYTVAMYLVKNNITPPEQWIYNTNIKNKCGFTICDYLQTKNIEIPKQLQIIEQDIQNKNILEYLIKYCEEYNIDKQTIINNPSQQNNNDKNTFAMYLAQNNIIPSKQFIHDPNIKGGQIYNFVRQYLENNHLPVPNEWYDNEYKQNNDYKPNYINDVFYGIITEKPENINPEQQYENKWTVAMIYAKQCIIPPKQWEHNPNLTNYNKDTVAMLLAKNKICDIPQQWQHNPLLKNKDQKTVAILLAENGIVPPKQFQYNPELQNISQNKGRTIAMMLAQNKIIPPEYWNHKPELQDNDGDTVALLLSQNGIIPPKQWEHNYYITDMYQKTVQDYLIENNIQVPQQWKVVNKQIEMTNEIKQMLTKYCERYNINNQQIIINYPQYQKQYDSDTFASYLELHNIQTPKEFQYDSQHRLYYNYTTAMLIAQHNILPSKCWEHKSEMQNQFGYTVSMYLAQKGTIPPKQWEHNPLLKNKCGDTVAIILSEKGIIPPKQWIHDIDIKNNNNKSIRLYLYKYRYYYINNQFVKLNKDNFNQYIQTEILNIKCQKCQKEDQQIFIITNCKHKICFQCFEKMIIINNYQKCPICRKEQWFKLIDQTQ